MHDKDKRIHDLIKESLKRRGTKNIHTNYISENERQIKNINESRVRKTSSKNFQPAHIHRPALERRPEKSLLTQVRCRFAKVHLPYAGSFNAGIAWAPDNERIVCVFRQNENNIIGCFLDSKYKVQPDSFFNFDLVRSADPRIIWTPDDKLLMVYSYFEGDMETEHVVGKIIMDKKDGKFINPPHFRITPSSIRSRQKNWVPFVHHEKIYIIANIHPHIIYELTDYKTDACNQVYETAWPKIWFNNFQLRGNTNPILLPDGNYLNTFHTSHICNGIHYYDNGAYTFEGQPPFSVLARSGRTYLPAESACEPHYRKKGHIVCNFPIGMLMREDQKLIISFGDNDSAVKIMETSIDDILKTLVKI